MIKCLYISIFLQELSYCQNTRAFYPNHRKVTMQYQSLRFIDYCVIGDICQGSEIIGC